MLLEDVILRALVLGLIPALMISLGGFVGLVGVKGREEYLNSGFRV